jgi:hypothetical protein
MCVLQPWKYRKYHWHCSLFMDACLIRFKFYVTLNFARWQQFCFQKYTCKKRRNFRSFDTFLSTYMYTHLYFSTSNNLKLLSVLTISFLISTLLISLIDIRILPPLNKKVLIEFSIIRLSYVFYNVPLLTIYIECTSHKSLNKCVSNNGGLQWVTFPCYPLGGVTVPGHSVI